MSERALTQPTSIRLSPVTRARLVEAARRTQRSQSDLIEETLQRHLESVASTMAITSQDEARATLRNLMGAGARACGPRTVEEIDADIREMRRDRF